MDLHRRKQISFRNADTAACHQNPLAPVHERCHQTRQRTRRERSQRESTMKQWDFDLVALHGPQEMTNEDRAYRGSRFSEVRTALYANPYRDGPSGQFPGPLPMFKSTIRNAWKGTFHPP